jgi:hypothetical protein
VRERRHQHGLPLPLAEKVLPFRLPDPAVLSAEPPMYDAAVAMAASRAKERMAEAWLRLREAERHGATEQDLRALESAYYVAVGGMDGSHPVRRGQD